METTPTKPQHDACCIMSPPRTPQGPPGPCAPVAVGGQGPREEDNYCVSRSGWAAAAPLAPGKLGDAKQL